MRDGPRSRKRLLLRSLDLTRFEDLVASLVFPITQWTSLRRSDAKPGAAVPTLVGIEVVGAGQTRDWVVKVFRTEGVPPKSLEALAAPVLERLDSLPQVLLLILDCDVPEATVQRWRDAVASRGVAHAFVWTARDLERRLYAERPDLLFAYFGVSTFRRLQRKVRTIRRRLLIKQRLLRELLRPVETRASAAERPFEKFHHAKIVLRSIDDESYPSAETQLGVARGWIEVDTYDLFHGGLEVVVATVDVVVDGEGRWAPIPVGYAYDASRFASIRAFEVGRIPYDHIVDYDLSGDEYYREPHLYCLFASGGLPFSEFRYYAVEDPYRIKLRPENMVGLADVAFEPDSLRHVKGLRGRNRSR